MNKELDGNTFSKVVLNTFSKVVLNMFTKVVLNTFSKVVLNTFSKVVLNTFCKVVLNTFSKVVLNTFSKVVLNTFSKVVLQKGRFFFLPGEGGCGFQNQEFLIWWNLKNSIKRQKSLTHVGVGVEVGEERLTCLLS